MKHKVQAHIDEIEFCKKILPIYDENIILEVSQFDTALMKNPNLINEKIRHWGYQHGFNYGYSSRRKAVLHRDNYTCQCCGKKNCRLEVHHIKFRSNGGSDDENNMITLCEECHKGIHNGVIVLDKKPKKMNLKHATHMSIIRGRLLKKYPNAIETFGFVTSENRNHLKLKKDAYPYIDCISGKDVLLGLLKTKIGKVDVEEDTASEFLLSVVEEYENSDDSRDYDYFRNNETLRIYTALKYLYNEIINSKGLIKVLFELDLSNFNEFFEFAFDEYFNKI